MITNYNEARVALRNEYDYPPEVVETLLNTLGYEKPKSINMELTLEEAKVLKSILSHIGGCPQTTARKYAHNLYLKLLDIEPEFENADVSITYSPTKSTIYFA